MVPKVNLLDESVEPTDEELGALMQDFQRVVIARSDAARAAFLEDLVAEISRVAQEDALLELSPRPPGSGNAA